MKNAYFRLPVNLTCPVEIGIYETPVNLMLRICIMVMKNVARTISRDVTDSVRLFKCISTTRGERQSRGSTSTGVVNSRYY